MRPAEAVTFKIDEASHYSLSKLVARKTWGSAVLWSVPILAILGVVSAWASQSLLDALMPLLVGMLAGFIIMAVLALQLRPKARRVYLESVSLQEDMTLSFDDDGFQIAQASGLYRTKWHQMVRWDENRDIFAVFPNRQMAIIFPKREIAKEIVDFMRDEMKRSGLLHAWRLRK